MRKNKDMEFELITRIRAGDTSAFKIIVEKYKDLSFSLACSILKNEQDAEDALQESFIKAFKGLGQFNFKSSFSTWFYKIVVNTCLTNNAKQQNDKQLIDFDSSVSIEIAENNTPFNELNTKERKEIVNQVIDTLKTDEALLLRLFYLAELSIVDIKFITGFKESKIKVTLLRARNSFQQKLEKMYGSEINLLS
jgi:RNA polymerase sigma-70 factor (ECF subfamily)